MRGPLSEILLYLGASANLNKKLIILPFQNILAGKHRAVKKNYGSKISVGRPKFNSKKSGPYKERNPQCQRGLKSLGLMSILYHSPPFFHVSM